MLWVLPLALPVVCKYRILDARTSVLKHHEWMPFIYICAMQPYELNCPWQIDKHTHTLTSRSHAFPDNNKKTKHSLIIIWLNANYDRNVSAHGHALAQLCHMSELTTHELTNTYPETHMHTPVCTWTWLTQRMGLATVKHSNSTQIRRYTPKHLKNVNILPIWSRHRWVTKPHPIMHCMKFLYLKMGRVE